MATSITITHEGKTYELAFTLGTIKQLEQAGFVLDEVQTKPSVRIPELFYGAFLAKNKGIKRNLVSEIWDNLNRKDDLIILLAQMYGEAQSSLLDDTEGNADWTLNE